MNALTWCFNLLTWFHLATPGAHLKKLDDLMRRAFEGNSIQDYSNGVLMVSEFARRLKESPTPEKYLRWVKKSEYADDSYLYPILVKLKEHFEREAERKKHREKKEERVSPRKKAG